MSVFVTTILLTVSHYMFLSFWMASYLHMLLTFFHEEFFSETKNVIVTKCWVELFGRCYNPTKQKKLVKIDLNI